MASRTLAENSRRSRSDRSLKENQESFHLLESIAILSFMLGC